MKIFLKINSETGESKVMAKFEKEGDADAYEQRLLQAVKDTQAGVSKRSADRRRKRHRKS